MTQQDTRNVVIGLDFGEYGDDALVDALTLFRAGWATHLHPVHVLDPRDVIDDPEKPALATEEEVLAQAPAALRERLTRVAATLDMHVPATAVTPHARLGKAADTLIQVAVDYDADLIVVGTHGRRGLERVLLGSVAETLARIASCPVFVARPKDHSRQPKSQRPDSPYKPGEEPVYTRPSDRSDHIHSEVADWRASMDGRTGFRTL